MAYIFEKLLRKTPYNTPSAEKPASVAQGISKLYNKHTMVKAET